MDPISMAIVAAASAGVTSGVTAVGKEAIVDAYKGIKNWIINRFGRDAEVTTSIAKVEQAPDSQACQAVLVEEIANARIAHEPELLALAQQLIEALKETTAGSRAVARFQVDAKGAQVGQIGDHNMIHGGIHFGEKK